MRKKVKPGKIILAVIAALVFIFLVAPVLIVIPLSFGASPYLEFPPRGFSWQWYEAYLGNSDWLIATWNSIKVAIIATAGSLILGTLGAFGLSRMKGFKRTALYTMFISPMVVPAIVMAVAFYFFFAEVSLVRTATSVVLAHMIIAMPYVVTNVTASLSGFDRNLERAAKSLGANPFITFFRVTLPYIRPGLVSGGLFAFITSFDEVIIANFLAGAGFTTLPMKMFAGIRNEIQPTIAATASILVVLSIILLTTVQIMGNRRLDRERGRIKQKTTK